MTPPPDNKRAAFLPPKLAIGLLLISALSFVAFFALNAYAPQLRMDRSGGANALSKSAVGFAGLRYMLERVGMPTRLLREPASSGDDSLVILTPDVLTSASDLKANVAFGVRLVVLPKWLVAEHPKHPGWVMGTGTIDAGPLDHMLSEIANTVKITRGQGAASVRLVSREDSLDRIVPSKPLNIQALQTLSGTTLEPIIVESAGKIVLARIRGMTTYILSDPDLLNNAGLHDRETAGFGVGLILALRKSAGPVSFDLTLNGVRASPNLLESAFKPPFLGATLCAILAAAFIAMHALHRFGPAQQPGRIQAFGKRALADNTAAVIRMTHREASMAPRYAEVVLNVLAAQAGVPRAEAREPYWLAALERRSGGPYRFTDLHVEAIAVRDAAGLMRVATKLHQWLQGMTGWTLRT